MKETNLPELTNRINWGNHLSAIICPVDEEAEATEQDVLKIPDYQLGVITFIDTEKNSGTEEVLESGMVSVSFSLSPEEQELVLPVVHPHYARADAPGILCVSEDFVVKQCLVIPAPGHPDERLTNVYLVPDTLVGDFRLREHFLNVEFRIGVSEELELCLVYRVLKGCVPVDSDCKVLNGAIEALVPKLEDSNCHNPVLDILYSSKDLTELLDSEIDGCFEQYLPRGASDE